MKHTSDECQEMAWCLERLRRAADAHRFSLSLTWEPPFPDGSRPGQWCVRMATLYVAHYTRGDTPLDALRGALMALPDLLSRIAAWDTAQGENERQRQAERVSGGQDLRDDPWTLGGRL